MKVVALKLKDEDGHIDYLRQAIIDKELGMIGEFPKREKNRQISILSERIRNLIDEEEFEGLCLFRFYENITIKDLEVKNIEIGQRLQIGETVQEVTAIGKRCFKECKLIQSGETCNLFMNVIFTKIIKSGFVKIDDKVVSLPSTDRFISNK
ncbi:MOSC domain-containing protein [Tissierella creatinophila]|uniref:MOSC domain protein n=1 Tax=Tissierella creatinophila DSM 6911 TaxID=1123403 RepID=A0A1U7M8W8_TISCR|nr:MOSC domain-containing protein [Tissierella creatinophila]OLS03726.1 MOSC domain protein [Tissierella creatinophila DSM 6911]